MKPGADMSNGKRWLITGVSSGFGRHLVEAALSRGDSIVGTVRQASQVAGIERLAPGRAHAVLLDVTHRKRIPLAVGEAVERLGGIDILVNNAGYGLSGALEELQEDEIDHVIETNLGGAINVIRAALPALRESRGRIVNITSMSGMVGFAGLSTYCTSKFGVEGLSLALRKELAPFGIVVMLVEPGSFATGFSAVSMRRARAPMAVYDGTPAGNSRDGLNSMAGREPGDAAKAADAIVRAIGADDPPMHLILGKDALAMIRAHRERVDGEIAAWEELTLSTELT
jgi:NAD(P)-dependent dehydrogenase (short-subunit alcohol dehydrogenase family)